MNVLERIDDWILKKFQTLSEWSEVTWDKNCYLLASYSASLMSFAMLVMAVAAVWGAFEDSSAPLILRFLPLPFSLMFTFWAWTWRATASRYKNASRVYKLIIPPPARYRILILVVLFALGPYLVIFTVFGITPIYNVGLLFFLVGGFLYLYFASCLPSHPDVVRKKQLQRVGQGNLKEA